MRKVLRKRRPDDSTVIMTPPVPPVDLAWDRSAVTFDATATVVATVDVDAIPGTYFACWIAHAPGSVTGNDGGLSLVATTTLTPTSSGGRMSYLEGVVGDGNTPGTPINITLDGSSRWCCITASTNVPATGALTVDPINSNGTTVSIPSAESVAGQLVTGFYGVITNTTVVVPTWTPDPLTTQLRQGTTLSGSARNASALVAYEIATGGATPVRTALVDQTMQRQSALLLVTAI